MHIYEKINLFQLNRYDPRFLKKYHLKVAEF